MVAISAVFAGILAIANSGIIGGFPPHLRMSHLQIATATNHVSVDLPAPAAPLSQRRSVPPQDIVTLVKRAELLGRMTVSQPVLERIAQRCRISPGDISGVGRTTANVPIALTEPNSERRASDIAASTAPYRLEVQGRPLVPVIDVFAEAPSVAGALCIANAAPVALTDYLQSLAGAQGLSDESLTQLTSLGGARGGVANGGATMMIALLTFLTLFGISFALLIGAEHLIGVRAQRAEGDDELEPVPAEPEDGRDCWPHTTRVLPWLLAAFIALIWLTPFNDIQLNASLPIELRLDRLVLPFLVLAWLLAFAAGGRVAPRLRMTWIHVALGGLLAVAFLSVVTDARYLNQTLELQLAIKKLPLIVSYVSLFVIAASSVRRGEVRAFMTFTLGLAMIVAVGMIWEYRMHVNLFWTWSDKLLPGFFSINGLLNGVGFDNVGRRIVRGPAEVPLEAVAMLTFALPIALVRIISTRRWRERLIYGLVICAIVAAMMATYRKSALIGPVAVVLTLLYFRRRELLRLAPLGMILLVLVSVVSPGALGSTVRQFTRSDAAAVPTVSDRTSDYDAVRPDVWSHLALGRGWGTYNHDSYRILDSEILSRVIETGVLGLVAFFMVSIVVVACSRRTIALRDPTSAPVALVGASIAVGFVVLAMLFDELSFPHAAYIFLYMIGFETVVLERVRRKAPVAAVPPEEPGREPDDGEFILEPAEGRLVPVR